MQAKAFQAGGAAILALALLAGCDSDSTSTSDETFQLQLLHFADVDGGGTAAMFNVDEFSALVDHFRSQDPERTILLSSGDNYIPGPIFEASTDARMADVVGEPGQGRGEIVIQNRLGVQVTAVGNHDLDTGPAGFAGIISPDGDYPGAIWPYISVNIDFMADSNTAPLVQDPRQEASNLPPGSLARSVVITVDGERVGVVGAVTPTLPAITSVGNLTLSPADFVENEAGFDALAAVIQEEVDALTAEGVDKIILAAHMQRINVERNLATRLRDVDIIVAGGSNTLLADSNDLLREGDSKGGDYPEIYESASGEPVLLVNTDADYKYLGRLVVEFDSDGVILTDKLDPAENGAWAATPTMVEQLKAEPIPEVVEVAEVIRQILGELDGTAYGITEVFLEGRRAEVRSRETNLGNLTADANLWYAQQMDTNNPPLVSVKNGGGIRAPIGIVSVPPGEEDAVALLPPAANDFGKPEGGISQLDIQTSLAFNNGLALVDMTAAELRDLLEELVKGNFGHTAGLRVEFDRSFEARSDGDSNQGAVTDGQQVREMKVCLGDWNAGACSGGWETVVTNGVTQSTDRSYRVVALDFLAACAAPAGSEFARPNCGSGWPFNGLTEANFASLLEERFQNADPGGTDFSSTGGEQDALAEYLLEFHSDADDAYDVAPDVNERLIPVSN
ncbi:5'-nucleotidase [Ectothiorhodospira haloalkaliphila]|uniref:5'-nucleotidase n=1 Tax=Ectothiorhodospira haloalkaliphila TaxID=421628 RepID=W8KLE0_9GAMM|nr:5'-nucleotidase C-terminal domain-containing protein [Ectothiorhodospira haloalkaliphila]AHK79983.1 5'-nucleotidase [Ectothiorhodospira haloalkaliphila]